VYYQKKSSRGSERRTSALCLRVTDSVAAQFSAMAHDLGLSQAGLFEVIVEHFQGVTIDDLRGILLKRGTR